MVEQVNLIEIFFSQEEIVVLYVLEEPKGKAVSWKHCPSEERDQKHVAVRFGPDSANSFGLTICLV